MLITYLERQVSGRLEVACLRCSVVPGGCGIVSCAQAKDNRSTWQVQHFFATRHALSLIEPRCHTVACFQEIADHYLELMLGRGQKDARVRVHCAASSLMRIVALEQTATSSSTRARHASGHRLPPVMA